MSWPGRAADPGRLPGDRGRPACPVTPRCGDLAGPGPSQVGKARPAAGYPGAGGRARQPQRQQSRSASGPAVNRSAGQAMSRPDAAGWCCTRPPRHPTRPAPRPGPRTGPRRRAAPGAGSVEPLDLPRRGRRTRLGQPVGDAVVAADPVEQHLTALAEPGGELLAIVGQHLLRHPERLQRLDKGQADRPAGGPRHDLAITQYREWSSTPVTILASRPSARNDPADDVHLPQLHRRVPLPAPVAACGRCAARAGSGRDAPAPDRRPSATAPAPPPPGHLKHQPHRTPPRMLPPQLTHQRLHLARPGAGTRAAAATGPPARPGRPRDTAHPGMHALPRHPYRAATSVTGTPAKTARTARYRCSTTDNSTSANPGLPPHAARKRRDRTTTSAAPCGFLLRLQGHASGAPAEPG